MHMSLPHRETYNLNGKTNVPGVGRGGGGGEGMSGPGIDEAFFPFPEVTPCT